jgi:rfaE bifunctional protein nucleotidyltransferase chain/domain
MSHRVGWYTHAAMTTPAQSSPSSTTSIADKILLLEPLAQRLAQLRAKGQRIVHCHGVFDLLHIGHIRYLERARQLGDVLVVTVTPDHFVDKGPHRPAFTGDLRVEALAALGSVDFVALNRWATAVETITLLKPDVFVKGSEYKELKDLTGAIARERDAVEAVGGRLAFTQDITFSSSSLLNRYMPVLPQATQDYLFEFAQRHKPEAVMGLFDRVKPLKVLVVGEAIIDDYQYCNAIGKSSKEATLVVRAGWQERFAGGILAVANHVASFCDQVTLVTQLGAQRSEEAFVRERLASNVTPHLLMREDGPTIVKRRFIDMASFAKLLEVYEINDAAPPLAASKLVSDTLDSLVAEHDLVIVVDFGHGMLNDDAVKILCEKARFLAVNTQANAGNLGYHTISKYSRADLICLAENELRLEARDRSGRLEEAVARVSERLGCPRIAVTQGQAGCLCFEKSVEKSQGFVQVPAVAVKIVDRVGAGDTFLSIAAPMAAVGATMEVAGFVGNVAGAEAVATVGHRRYLERLALMKHVQVLLK